MTLGIEIGIAVFLVLMVFCAKPEYGLFFYGLALGFPDIAIPVGTAINLRLDDVLIALFLLRSIAWVPAPMSASQRKIAGTASIFFSACVLSAIVGIASSSSPEPYDLARMLGCAAIAIAIPRAVQSDKRLRFLIAGLFCGGVALTIQIAQRLGSGALNGFAKFQQLKAVAAFTTWNPNTIGQAAMLFAFAAGIGATVLSKNRLWRTALAIGATGFAMIPLLVFERGASVSIAAGFILYLCLARRWKWVALFAAACFFFILYLHAQDRALVESAAQVDIVSGEGLSHRFDRWQAAGEAIMTHPLLGHGFGQEWNVLNGSGSEGRAHNAFLAVWLELGLGGLLLFLTVVYKIVSVGYSLYEKHGSRTCGALILALIAAECIDSFGLPTLYWQKLPTIALSIAVAYAGICERDASETESIHATAHEWNPVFRRA